MIIQNPTNQTVAIVIKGVSYSIDSGMSRDIPNAHAIIWLETHGFLRPSPLSSEPEAPVIQEQEDEVPEEEPEEEKEKKDKKPKNKKK